MHSEQLRPQFGVAHDRPSDRRPHHGGRFVQRRGQERRRQHEQSRAPGPVVEPGAAVTMLRVEYQQVVLCDEVRRAGPDEVEAAGTDRCADDVFVHGVDRVLRADPAHPDHAGEYVVVPDRGIVEPARGTGGTAPVGDTCKIVQDNPPVQECDHGMISIHIIAKPGADASRWYPAVFGAGERFRRA